MSLYFELEPCEMERRRGGILQGHKGKGKADRVGIWMKRCMIWGRRV